jgi:hypothetical protein
MRRTPATQRLVCVIQTATHSYLVPREVARTHARAAQQRRYSCRPYSVQRCFGRQRAAMTGQAGR